MKDKLYSNCARSVCVLMLIGAICNLQLQGQDAPPGPPPNNGAGGPPPGMPPGGPGGARQPVKLSGAFTVSGKAKTRRWLATSLSIKSVPPS